MNPIKHVAIIMDGNGRWGLKHKKSRNLGHREGLNTVEKISKEDKMLQRLINQQEWYMLSVVIFYSI